MSAPRPWLQALRRLGACSEAVRWAQPRWAAIAAAILADDDAAGRDALRASADIVRRHYQAPPRLPRRAR